MLLINGLTKISYPKICQCTLWKENVTFLKDAANFDKGAAEGTPAQSAAAPQPASCSARGFLPWLPRGCPRAPGEMRSTGGRTRGSTGQEEGKRRGGSTEGHRSFARAPRTPRRAACPVPSLRSTPRCVHRVLPSREEPLLDLPNTSPI